jgi:hypothetical protein
MVKTTYFLKQNTKRFHNIDVEIESQTQSYKVKIL